MSGNVSNISTELLELPQWVCWRYDQRDGKPTKIPMNPNTGGGADVTNAATWTNYETARNSVEKFTFDGAGFVFTANDPFCGIDLDKCRDPETGELDTWAQKIISRLNSYTEVSPSRTGVKIWIKGRLPFGARKRKKIGKGQIEFYDQKHYFTVTGQHLAGTPETIENRQEELLAVHTIICGSSKEKQAESNRVGRSALLTEDMEILDRAMNARNGEKFQRLWKGDISEYDGDDSRADLALCCLLAFWTRKDTEQIDRLFRHSRLMRKKWNRKDYRKRTIQAAIDATPEVWKGTAGGNDGELSSLSSLMSQGWPDPLQSEAYHGVVGDVVQAIAPHTESDPAAILLQLLIAFGSIAGRNAFYKVEADLHYPNLYGVFVGETSKGRKGTSWGHVAQLFESVDPDWKNNRVLEGLSSGEGLIWAVSDEPNQKRKERK